MTTQKIVIFRGLYLSNSTPYSFNTPITHIPPLSIHVIWTKSAFCLKIINKTLINLPLNEFREQIHNFVLESISHFSNEI